MQSVRQNTKEWEEFRRTKIGASDAPVILGVSPWKTAYQLWEEKLGLRSSQYTNAAMQRGHELESQALDAYNSYTGNAAKDEVVVHPDHEWMMASLDGISLDRSIVVEIKCPGSKDHAVAANGLVPEKYYPQLQHQLAVIGLNLLHYFSYSDDGFHLVEVPRDDNFIKKLYKEEGDFYEKLKKFTPPELSDRDYVQMDSVEWRKTASEWLRLKEELNLVEMKEKVLREQLIGLANDKNAEGDGIRVQKVVRKGSVDYKLIPELSSIDLENFRKPPVTSWRLSMRT